MKKKSVLSRFQLQYGGVWGDVHGSANGTMEQFTLAVDETITNVRYRHTISGLRDIKFITSKGNVHGPYTGTLTNTYTSVHVRKMHFSA